MAVTTIRERRFVLDDFGRYLKAAQRTADFPHAVDRRTIRGYMGWAFEAGATRGALGKRLGGLRALFLWLRRRGTIEADPLAGIRTPRGDRSLPQVLTVEQVKTLLDAPAASTWIGARDLAILETLYSTGMRVVELSALNIESVDFAGEQVKVRGKGKRERLCILGPAALRALVKWLAMRDYLPTREPIDGRALFLDRKGRRITPGQVGRMLAGYVAAAGLPAFTSPHTLRHSAATHMLNAGASIRHVQEFLGHASLSSTMIYTHLSRENVRAAYNAAHPRAFFETTARVMRLLDESTGLMECTVCNAQHVARRVGKGRFASGSWQCRCGCRLRISTGKRKRR